MKKATLVFCTKDDQVLLAMKKRGFGAGKWNGYGGKVRENESPKVAAIRELGEESSIVADEDNLQQVALVHFSFDGKPAFECHVYTLISWQGTPVETEEMRPQWYQTGALPFEEMWVADVKWIPIILYGEKIKGEVNFNADGSVVKNFSYTSAEFN